MLPFCFTLMQSPLDIMLFLHCFVKLYLLYIFFLFSLTANSCLLYREPLRGILEWSPLFTLVSPLFTFVSPLFTFDSPLFTFVSPLFTFVSPLFTFVSPLFTFISPLFTFVSPLFTFVSPLFTFAEIRRVPPTSSCFYPRWVEIR